MVVASTCGMDTCFGGILFYFQKEKGVYVLICMYIYFSTAQILVQSLQAPDLSPLLARYPQVSERPHIQLLQAT
jgi:hypothetical protein